VNAITRGVLEAAGYILVRYSFRMAIALDGSVEMELPDRVELRPYEPEHEPRSSASGCTSTDG
jgi:hypothetical protein